VQDTTLTPFQIEHIRKMKQGLGLLPAAADAEENTMDRDLGALSAVGDVDAADADVDAAVADVDAADAAVGGLAVYNNPNVQTSMTAFNKLAAEQQARYDAQAKALAEKRYGPSFSERMFQLSAALAQPTTRRGFGGILENVTPVLAAQQKAQREGEISRKDALELLENNRLAARMGLAKQGLTTSLAMAKLEAMANKPPTMKSVIVENGVAYDPVSGAKVVQPDASAWAALAAYPTQANLDNFIRNFGPRFAEQAMRTVGSATGGQ
jgi:hypothetical protein